MPLPRELLPQVILQAPDMATADAGRDNLDTLDTETPFKIIRGIEWCPVICNVLALLLLFLLAQICFKVGVEMFATYRAVRRVSSPAALRRVFLLRDIYEELRRQDERDDREEEMGALDAVALARLVQEELDRQHAENYFAQW